MLAPACGGDLPRSVVDHFGSKWTSTLPIVVALQVHTAQALMPSAAYVPLTIRPARVLSCLRGS